MAIVLSVVSLAVAAAAAVFAGLAAGAARRTYEAQAFTSIADLVGRCAAAYGQELPHLWEAAGGKGQDGDVTAAQQKQELLAAEYMRAMNLAAFVNERGLFPREWLLSLFGPDVASGEKAIRWRLAKWPQPNAFGPLKRLMDECSERFPQTRQDAT